MSPSFGYEDLSSELGLFRALLTLAQHWRVLDIPEGKAVTVIGLEIVGDEVVKEGVITVAERVDEPLTVMDCTFDGDGGNALTTVDTLIGLLNRELEAADA